MKGILFTADNIRAIEDNRKTVTRRLIKPQPRWQEPNHELEWQGRIVTLESLIYFARYHVGEVVYIKEAWATEKKYNHLKPRDLPRQSAACLTTARIYYYWDYYNPDLAGKPRSPLFMPAWAARYFIRILDVRAERLCEITFDDCVKEGFGDTERDTILAKAQFINAWNEINPKHLWSGNWWVFRYEFIKVDRP